MYYHLTGYAFDCYFLKLKSKGNPYDCSALSDFYNDSSEDPCEHDCLGCVFYKTKDMINDQKLKTLERLENLKRGMI